MRLIDTHCHLNILETYPDPEPEFAACAREGIGLILVGVDPKSSRRAVDLAESHDNVWAIVGRHPNYTADYKTAELEQFKDMLQSPKAVALGEIGLDFHWQYATLYQQEKALIEQLDLAGELGVPVVFHCREAYPELLSRLEKLQSLPKTLFHCFAGDEGDAERALNLGTWFGVDGPLTYKKADALRTLVAGLPHDRVVLETDSPYLPPTPHRGKPNSPTYLPLIAAELARVWDVSVEEAAGVTTDNAKAFFDL